MIKFPKAASFAAAFFALASVTIYTDAGFALGNAEADTVLTADTISIDPAILAADLSAVAMASTPDVEMTVLDNGDVVFTPGIGDAAPMPVPSDEENSQQDERNERPISASSLQELVRLQDTGGELNAEEQCLAGAVYFESKGESLAGQLAVAKVVLARTESGRFPSSICGVVYQKSQFSFVRGGRMPAINKASPSWKNAVAISRIALDNSWKSSVEGALFFHARYVNPGWRLRRLGSIDNHIFYR
jgi:hypothetical protein